MKCISCDFEHNENFCPNCGEKSGTKKITFASIFEDAFSSITNMDRGFLFNLKSLILNPQKVVQEYVSGRRKGILNPISFLIISITIYLIVITVFKVPKEVGEVNGKVYNEEFKKAGLEIGAFLRTNIKYFWILAIIPLGLSLKLIFRKYNFFEHLAISSFIIGQATLIGIISYLIFRIPLIFDPFVYLVVVLLVYKVFRNRNEDRIEAILLAGTILVLFIIQLMIMLGTIGIVQHYL